MKKEFSYYEFVGLIVPGVTLMYTLGFVLETKSGITILDFKDFGRSIVLVIVSYGLGHMIHAIGNFFEPAFWFFFNGMPTNWLTKKPYFFQKLLDESDSKAVLKKIYKKFPKVNGKDYGRNVYSILFQKDKTVRIDAFNGNYSMFRALTITFGLIAIVACIYLGWAVCLIFVLLSTLSLLRMFRFAKLYAREIFRSYLTLEAK